MDLNIFSKKLSSIMPDLMRQFLRRQSGALARGKISVPQMAIMQLLLKEKICTMTDISEHLGITMAAATGLADRLVAAKLVQRSGHLKDRRIVNITLTEKGKAIVQDARRQMEKVTEDVFGKLTDEERKNYLHIVEKLLLIMKQEGKEHEL